MSGARNLSDLRVGKQVSEGEDRPAIAWLSLGAIDEERGAIDRGERNRTGVEGENGIDPGWRTGDIAPPLLESALTGLLCPIWSEAGLEEMGQGFLDPACCQEFANQGSRVPEPLTLFFSGECWKRRFDEDQPMNAVGTHQGQGERDGRTQGVAQDDRTIDPFSEQDGLHVEGGFFDGLMRHGRRAVPMPTQMGKQPLELWKPKHLVLSLIHI